MEIARVPVITGLGRLLHAYFRGEPATLPAGQTPESLREQVKSYGLTEQVSHALSPSKPAVTTNLAVRNLSMITLAAEFSALLAAQNIPHSFVRGAALLPLYPHPDDRSFSDLDLLVPPAYAQKALAIILAKGAMTGERDRISFLTGYWDGIQLFLPPPQKSLLELHIDLAPPGRFPNPLVTAPPYSPADELPLHALAVILHESTHHYQQPGKALCDVILLAAKGLDWDALGRLISARRAWNAVNPFILDLERFAPGVAPGDWLSRIRTAWLPHFICALADAIHRRGGVYAQGSFWRRSLLTALALPDGLTAMRALWRGLAIRHKHSKIKVNHND